MNELHHMGRDAAEGGFCKYHSASHREEFRFPAPKFSLHVVNYELKVITDRSGVENGKDKVFAKMGTVLDAKDTSIIESVSSGAVPGEQNFGLT